MIIAIVQILLCTILAFFAICVFLVVIGLPLMIFTTRDVTLAEAYRQLWRAIFNG